MLRVLIWCAARGRYLLVAGLAAGVLFEPLAQVLMPWIGEMVGLMLLIAAFRIGPAAAIGARRDLGQSLLFVAAYQLALPLVVIAGFTLAGSGGAVAGAIILLAAGSAISGAPNLTILCGADPAPALRLLVVGTALLPLTVLPVFYLMPELGGGLDALLPALRLLAVISLCSIAGFYLRLWLGDEINENVLRASDGLSALVMVVVVIGLMSAVGPALRETPGELLAVMAAAFGANFGLQLAALAAQGMLPDRGGKARVAFSIIAGNRNMALFLTALPASVTDPMLLFIGCYQFPMYLTPLLLGPVYSARSRANG